MMHDHNLPRSQQLLRDDQAANRIRHSSTSVADDMRLPFFQAQSTSRVCWSVGIHENENIMRSTYPNARPCRREQLPFFYHQHGYACNWWLYTPAGRKRQLALGKTCSVVLVSGLEFFCDRHSEDQQCFTCSCEPAWFSWPSTASSTIYKHLRGCFRDFASG